MPSKNKKIVSIIIIILVAVGVLIETNRIFHFHFLFIGLTTQKNITSITELKQGSFATSTALNLPREKGRVRVDLAPNAPTDFPVGLPIELKPLKVISSYKETFAGESALNEQPHTQITYSYVTNTSVSTLGSAFQAFFKAKGFDVKENYDASKLLYTLLAKNTRGDTFTVIVAVYDAKLKEQIVTVSEITPGIKK